MLVKISILSLTSADELILEDVLRGPEKEQWELAVKEELKSFEDNDPREVVEWFTFLQAAI